MLILLWVRLFEFGAQSKCRTRFFVEPATQLLFLFFAMISVITNLLTFFKWHKCFLFDSCSQKINFSPVVVLYVKTSFTFTLSLFGGDFFFFSSSFNFSFFISIFFFTDQNNSKHAKFTGKNCRKNYGLVSLFANLCFHYWGFSTILHINHPENKAGRGENLCIATHWTIILNPQIECNCSWKMWISVMFHMCSGGWRSSWTVFIQTRKNLQIQ